MIIRVPATSANLGPGFDVLACALSLSAQFRLSDDRSGRRPVDDRHPALRAFRAAGGTGPLWVRSPVPMGRGLGSSAAMRVGGVVAAVAQRHGPDVDPRHPDLGVMALAAELEGHADNAAAALHGGVVVAVAGEVITLPTPPGLKVVVWIPPQATRTSTSRRALPPTVPFADAVFNLGRVAALVASLATGRYDLLALASQDRLHQDRRLEAHPASSQAMADAMSAGALGAWLSGSGPSVASWCRDEQADQVAASLPPSGRSLVLDLDQHGTVVDPRG